MNQNIDQLSISIIRGLVIDITNNANSGHPGMALDFAPSLYALYRDHLVIDPKKPNWFNRDRLIYSAGHVSALIYSLLHLSGYEVSLDDLKRFRQLGSITPGHPEVGLTPGIDATAGPLGQGLGQAVGMAVAESHLRAKYGEGVISHYTYCVIGDGCLQEGISQEAISLAGLYKLNKLIVLFDKNGATLDGPTSDSCIDDEIKRFEASSWNVIEVNDGQDFHKVSLAISKAKESKDKPTLILIHNRIGTGSAFEGSSKTHGSPLGEEDGRNAKASFGLPDVGFYANQDVYDNFSAFLSKRNEKAIKEYETAINELKTNKANLYKELIDSLERNVSSYLPMALSEPSKTEATRESAGRYVSLLHESMPFSFGGSADVASSTKTRIKGSPYFGAANPLCRDMPFGIREFGMAEIQNGILLHGGLVTYVSCFFVFSDYMKAAIRMSAMEKIPAIYLFTHDSIALGEDGLTHQPIEQLPALRCIPNLSVIRPCDYKEVSGAMEVALRNKNKPTALILSRQGVEPIVSSNAAAVSKGAYFVSKGEKPVLSLLATGSEVKVALDCASLLKEKGINVDVISMPSMDLFEGQEESYKKEILHLPLQNRVSIELSSTFGWAKYAGLTIGIDEYGASGKKNDVLAHFGFTVDKLVERIVNYVKEDLAL